MTADSRCHPGTSVFVTNANDESVRATTTLVTFSEDAAGDVWWALTVKHLFEGVRAGTEVRHVATPGGVQRLGVFYGSSSSVEIAAVRVDRAQLVASSALDTPETPRLMSAAQARGLLNQQCSFCVDMPSERFVDGVVSAVPGTDLLTFREDTGFVPQFGHSGAPLYVMSGSQRRLVGLLVSTLGVPPNVEWTFEYPGLGLAELGIRMREDA